MIFNTLNNNYPQLKYTEKRSRRRSLCDIPALVQELDDRYIFKANIINHHNRGLYLETDFQLNLGKDISIGIDKSSSGSMPQTYYAKILWVKRLTKSDYNYGYGAKFIRGSDNPQSNNLNFVDELRKHTRRQFRKPVFLILPNNYHQGMSKDISRGGMFIKTTHRFHIGQRVKLVIPVAKFNKGLWLKSKVAHIKPDGIGIRFLKLIKAHFR